MIVCKPECHRSNYASLSIDTNKKVFYCKVCRKRHLWKVNDMGAPIKELPYREVPNVNEG